MSETAMGRDKNQMYKWRKDNQKRIEFYLHKELNKDVLEWLEKQPNKREYIIKLIEDDMKRKEG